MTHPVIIVGGGPVGLAAAAHCVARGLEPLVLEAGDSVGAAIRDWGHVRMFSPWEFNIDAAARALLDAEGWQAPDGAVYPTGHEFLSRYLLPLGAARALRSHIRTNARVVGVARRGHGRLTDGPLRATEPFVVQIQTADGAIEEIVGRAVLDCSGTWGSPNPAGAHGMSAPGEVALARHVATGIPDVLGSERETYAGLTTMVVGAGHSAMNALLDLATLAEAEPHTRIFWALRRPLEAMNFGGGSNDGLAQRGALGQRAATLLREGRVEAWAPFPIAAMAHHEGRLTITATNSRQAVADRIIVATGFRPDFSFLREMRLGLDVAVEATPTLAPLIDPNLHSCGTVRPHGELELRHPEANFWIAGMKSYGRAPTFLMATGHEQVRSIVAALAGDWAAARDVQLVLPETGVCSTDRVEAACCTPVTPQGVRCPPKLELPTNAPCCAAPQPAKVGCCG